MKRLQLRTVGFLGFVLLGAILSTISSWFYFKQTRDKLINNLIGIEFALETQSIFKSNLYYTYGDSFSSNLRLSDVNLNNDTLLFEFPRNNDVITKIRLDFGNDRRIKPVKINRIKLLFKSESIILEEKSIIQKCQDNSPALILNKESGIIEFNEKLIPFDPYLVFSPLVEFTINHRQFAIYLLSPMILCLLLYFTTKFKTYWLTAQNLIFFLFIFCIPLKIAWTTFAAILLSLYGAYRIVVQRKPINNTPLAYLLLFFFLTLFVLGRPSRVTDIDIQLGLIIWAIISLTLKVPKVEVLKAYVYYFIIIIVLVLASGIGFLLWFNDLYGLQLLLFFKDIKLYSRELRGWLYYDHAAFLSFFGIIGILFLQKLYRLGQIKKNIVWTFHILIISLILITATRIGIIIYLLIVLNVVFLVDYKKRWILNSIAFIIFSCSLVAKIDSIDRNRAILWKNSWHLIKEKPFFGYGIGQSDKVLHSFNLKKGNVGLPILELNHSHNQFLTFLLEFGFVGIFILSFALCFFLFSTSQYRNDMMITFLFASGYLFLTESALQTSKPLYVISFLLLSIYSSYMEVPKVKEFNNRIEK